jgi:hypothetical protein
MQRHHVSTLQQYFPEGPVKERFMAIYNDCVTEFFNERRAALQYILKEKGVLVLALFENPVLVEGLNATLLQEFPEHRHLILSSYQEGCRAHFVRLEQAIWAHLLVHAGAQAPLLWAKLSL